MRLSHKRKIVKKLSKWKRIRRNHGCIVIDEQWGKNSELGTGHSSFLQWLHGKHYRGNNWRLF